MTLSDLDYLVFAIFFVLVFLVAYKTGHKSDSIDEYFLAGRSLPWWIIGCALLATGISTEQTVAVTGLGSRIGFAVSSYQLLAAVVLVVISLFILPLFLRAGISTIPEYLEYRFDKTTRGLMAILILVLYILGPMASVLYSGAFAFETFLGIDKIYFVQAIGLTSALFIIRGGLSSIVWTDLVFVAGVLLSMALVTVLGLINVGGFENFVHESDGRLHTVLPADSREMPWPSVFLGGLWVAHFFYWGFNQFTTQRAFAAKTLSEGQKGMLFTASILILYTFLLTIPGIVSYEIFGDLNQDQDHAFPLLIGKLLPVGLKGFVFAAMFGGVLASMNNMLNSSASIFTLDIYKTFIKKYEITSHYVYVGRIATCVLIIISTVYAPNLNLFVKYFNGSIYEYLQTVWGGVSPSVVAVFLMGFLVWKMPPLAAKLSLGLNPFIYLSLIYFFNGFSELFYLGIAFVLNVVLILVVTFIKPLKEKVAMPEKKNVKFERNLLVFIWGIFIVIFTLAIYMLFI